MAFFRGKRVLITGHTGFKGSWLCRILTRAGAEVAGYSLDPPTETNLFTLAHTEARLARSVHGDVRDFSAMQQLFSSFQPEIVLHLAAQPLVRMAYREPRETYETNVMGTVNLLECVRRCPSVRSVLNVTTDKVYENREWCWGYRENEPLDGFDPYSNSKSCSELVTHSYVKSFFADTGVRVSTARAGNVIGGGDFAADRIVPDCVRAALAKKSITVRNPNSVRPYQHVLEPLFAYLLIVEKQLADPALAGSYNVGPDPCDCVSTAALVDSFCAAWGDGLTWVNAAEANAPHEAAYLRLDCSKIKTSLSWQPRWHMDDAIRAVADWTRAWMNGGDLEAEMDREINLYMGDAR